jgi:hypothetical protein
MGESMRRTVAVLALLFVLLSIGGVALEYLVPIEEEFFIYFSIFKELVGLVLAGTALYYLRLARKTQPQL